MTLNVLRILNNFSTLEKMPAGRSLPLEAIYHLSRAQRELGHKLIVLAGQEGKYTKYENIDGIEVYHIPYFKKEFNLSLASFTLFSYPKIYLLVDKCNVDLIHGHGIFMGLGPIILKKLIKKKLPIIVHCHNTAKGWLKTVYQDKLTEFGKNATRSRDITYIKNYILWEKATYNSVNAIITVSNSLKEELTEFYAIPEDKVYTCYNGVDSNLFRKTDASNLRERLKLENREKVILFVGPIGQRKGFNYLIEAAFHIKKMRIPVKIVTAGSLGYPLIFRKLMIKYNVSDMFLHVGFVSQIDLPAYYSLADILVLPSNYEGFPSVILEAMACKTAVVATTVCGIPEVVENGKNGILVWPRDAEELSDRILELLCDDKRRREIGEAGRDMVAQKFTWRQSAERLDSIYGAVLRKQY